MSEYRLEIQLEITPHQFWHIGSGLGRPDIQRMVTRDGRGRPLIPGSHLKGIIRQCCEDLSESAGLPVADPHDATRLDTFTGSRHTRFIVDRLFGSRFEGGRLFFRPAYWEFPDAGDYYERAHSLALTRTAVDRFLGTVKDKHLFQSEYVVGGKFATTVSGRHDFLTGASKADWPIEYAFLVGGICLLDQVGGDKSLGKGRIALNIKQISFNGTPISLLEALAPLEEADMEDWINLLREEVYGK